MEALQTSLDQFRRQASERILRLARFDPFQDRWVLPQITTEQRLTVDGWGDPSNLRYGVELRQKLTEVWDRLGLHSEQIDMGRRTQDAALKFSLQPRVQRQGDVQGQYPCPSHRGPIPG